MLPTGAASLELLTDTTKMTALVGGATALFLGLFGAREASRVVGRTAERWLGTPSLVSCACLEARRGGVDFAGGCFPPSDASCICCACMLHVLVEP